MVGEALAARVRDARRSSSGTTEVESTTTEWAWIVCLVRACQGYVTRVDRTTVGVQPDSQLLPNALRGRVKLIGSLWALNSSRK